LINARHLPIELPADTVRGNHSGAAKRQCPSGEQRAGPRAIAHSVDKQALVASFMGAYGEAVDG